MTRPIRGRPLAPLLVAMAGLLWGCGRTPFSECGIGTTLYHSGEANPANACQICQPDSDLQDWTNASAGTPCGVGGQTFCSQGTCQAGCWMSGSFVPGGKCLADACIIGGKRVPAGTIDPTNACLACEPSVDPTRYTPHDGLAPPGMCGIGGLCAAGVCTHGCWINGSSHSSGQVNPDDACLVCDPSRAVVSWSPRPDGTRCGGGAFECLGGFCVQGCVIGGIAYPEGAGSPENPCQTCQPSVNLSDWSSFGGGPSRGCVGICVQGVCQNACLLNGQVVPKRGSDPLSTSRCCNPAFDPIGWRPLFSSAGRFAYPPPLRRLAIAVGDLTGDGLPDVVALDDNALEVYVNQGGGAFAGPVEYPVNSLVDPSTELEAFFPTVEMRIADLDGDGLAEVAFDNGSAISVLHNFGNAVLGSEVDLPLKEGAALGLELVDLNGDGRPDLISAESLYPSFGSAVTVRFNLGDGGFGPEYFYGLNDIDGLGSPKMAVGDVKGDGQVDVAVVQLDQGIQLLTNDGTGQLEQGLLVPSLTYPDALGFGDFNGDGLPDLAVSSNGAETYPYADLQLLLNAGQGIYSPVAIANEAGFGLAFYGTIAVADFNGDGRLDLIAGSGTGGSIYVFLNSGAVDAAGNPFLPPSTIETGSAGDNAQYWNVLTADLNGDGAPDVVVPEHDGWTFWVNGCP